MALRAGERLADLDDVRRPPPIVAPVRAADEPWAARSTVDDLRDEPVRLTEDGIVIVIGPHRLSALEDVLRLGVRRHRGPRHRVPGRAGHTDPAAGRRGGRIVGVTDAVSPTGHYHYHYDRNDRFIKYAMILLWPLLLQPTMTWTSERS